MKLINPNIVVLIEIILNYSLLVYNAPLTNNSTENNKRIKAFKVKSEIILKIISKYRIFNGIIRLHLKIS